MKTLAFSNQGSIPIRAVNYCRAENRNVVFSCSRYNAPDSFLAQPLPKQIKKLAGRVFMILVQSQDKLGNELSHFQVIIFLSKKVIVPVKALPEKFLIVNNRLALVIAMPHCLNNIL